MSDAAFVLDPCAGESRPFCLRVLGGRAAGAERRLEPGASVHIGYALLNDVVLRDSAAKGLKLRLKPSTGAAELEVVEGEIALLGHVLAAPAHAILPPYVPVSIGDAAFALGEPGSPRWDEAHRLLAPLTSRDGDTAPEEPAAASAWDRLAGLSRRLRPGLLPLTAAIFLGGAATVGRDVVSSIAFPPADVPSVQRELNAAGYRDLTVHEAPDGRIVVRGTVAHERDRAKLSGIFQARRMSVALEVNSGESLALRVEDVFRTHGLQADAVPAGAGVIRVAVKGGDPTTLETVQAIVQRDVRGLKRLQLDAARPLTLAHGDAAAGEAKRVLSVVSGEVAYVATADGARYFPGAILPTGHRIVAIADQTVTVEKDGRATRMIF